MSFSLLSVQLLAEESLPTTPFSLLLGKHRQQQDARSGETSENELVQLPVTENIPAINEVSGGPADAGSPWSCRLCLQEHVIHPLSLSGVILSLLDLGERREGCSGVGSWKACLLWLRYSRGSLLCSA